MTADAAPRPAAATRTSIVDGNALAGVLSGVFAVDPTLLTLVCAHCGRTGLLAETVVERTAASAIVRCRGCTRTLLVASSVGGEVRMRLAALAELRAEPPAQ
ncbi:DUF6510 family protein [Microbacterium flavum]|uniref:Uncharacterized protein n=1 Tax=Microbacterium flavum TaxID=415216 RepID=A0ABS5XWP4_9MICO|nr:DUF6510 family protein [Microbacterium flavum]MBT8798940.1 hypothetical protein [Microbacterium flavum]